MRIFDLNSNKEKDKIDLINSSHESHSESNVMKRVAHDSNLIACNIENNILCFDV